MEKPTRWRNETLLLKCSLGASKARGNIILSVDDDFSIFPEICHTAVRKDGLVEVEQPKQKVNAGSSELIAGSDALSDVVWSRYFLIEQGYSMEPSILHQDNESTIKLLNNGRRSSKRTKHVKNRFFAVH